MSKLNEGDRVYSITYGYGNIISISEGRTPYMVRFDSDPDCLYRCHNDKKQKNKQWFVESLTDL